MATQIDNLRVHFNGLNTAQQKEFIDKLKVKVQASKSPELTRFLNECVQKYNSAINTPVRNARNDSLDDLMDVGADRGMGRSNKLAEPVERLLGYFIDALFFAGCLIPFVPLLWVYLANKDLKKRLSPLFNVVIVILSAITVVGLIINSPYSYMFASMSWWAMIFASWIYIDAMCWRESTSFGKLKMGMRVIHKETGVGISIGSMFMRETFGKWISGMVFLMGWIWILIDSDKQGWHDKLVTSIVVKK